MTFRFTLLLSCIAFAFSACGDGNNENSNNTVTNGSSNNHSNNGASTSQSNGSSNNIQSNNGHENNGNSDDCIPSKAQWEATVKGRVEKNCGSCHGAEPEFGAPYGLLDYDTLVAGEIGQRKVDKIAPRTADYSMPPNGVSVSHQDRDTITEWASCGNIHPDHTVSLTVNRQTHQASAKPEGLTEFTFTAPGFAVDENTLDDYECFTFDAPPQGKFISRIEPIIDDSRVLHHLVLIRTNEAAGLNFSGVECGAAPGQFYYAWAPGGGPLQFPNGGGLKINEGDRFLLQIHYNNGAGVIGVNDNSGVKVFLSDTASDEYRMLNLGEGLPGISVAPGATIESSQTCTVTKDMTSAMGLPHMHEIGSEFHETIIRAATGQEESLVDLTGWSFENQPFYDYNIPLKAGDKIKTTCVYKNDKSTPVLGGFKSSEEMCFDFMFITPASADCR